MKTRKLAIRILGIGLVAAWVFVPGSMQRADASGSKWEPNLLPGTHHAHDFSDGFYRANGLEPTKFAMRKTPDGVVAVYEKTKDPTRNNTRILATDGGYNQTGSLMYYPDPPAMFFENAFTDNPAGEKARELADRFRVFIFPKASGPAFSPAPPNRRQDNVFDTTGGYLTHNPLGLWRLTFVKFTDAALNTPEGQAALAVLHDRNGANLDGTPIIKRLSEVQDLEARGFVTLYQRNADGRHGPPWVV